MKKIILPIIILSLLFGGVVSIGIPLVSYGVNSAQAVELSPPGLPAESLPKAGLTPDSPFYFLKSWKERIQLFFIFSAENKAKQHLHLSEVRLAEYKKMIEKEKMEIAQRTLDKYQKQLDRALKKLEKAKKKGKDVEELATLITEKTLKHQEVLSEVFEKVPEEAKKGVDKAIEVSRKGSEEAVQSVTGAKKEELQQKIKTFDWQIFIDSKVGYTIKYPSGWRKVDFENGMGVGPREIKEDILWGIWFYDSSQMSEDEIISRIGSQFELGRNVIRENIRFNNIQALKVIATTSQFPDWYSESIIIEHDEKIFRIGNGAIKDDKFEFFYRSFKFVGPEETKEEVPEEEEVKKSKVEKPGDESRLQKEDVVAVVNGVEITDDEFIQKLKVYILSNESQMRKAGQWQGANETENEFIQRFIPLIGKGILESMIAEIIIDQKAKEQNITVEPEEIDKKIDELKVTTQKLSKMDMTIEELRQQVQGKILMDKIVAKQVTVTEKEIKDYFERYKDNFSKPEEIKASHILLRTEIEAEVILSQLKAGADFAELARKESTDTVTKDKGGDLGLFSRGKMTPTFEEAAFALESGELSEVVKTPYGYHIIKVKERKPAQEPNLELEREEIKKTLTQQKTWTTESNLFQNLRKEAQVEIILPELRD